MSVTLGAIIVRAPIRIPRVAEKRAALIDEQPFAQLKIQAVIGVEGGVDRQPGWQRSAEYLLQQLRPAHLVVERRTSSSTRPSTSVRR
ncbi:MAG: hypothetical protein U0R77_09990 [Mycolicibacterium insubricum]